MHPSMIFLNTKDHRSIYEQNNHFDFYTYIILNQKILIKFSQVKNNILNVIINFLYSQDSN